MFKRIVLLFFVAAAVFAQAITIKFSHVVSESTPKGMAAKYFAKRVGELTNGRVKIKVYPNSQLYSDGQVIKAMKLNSLQMAAPSYSKLVGFIPQYQVFDLPYLFNDYDAIHRAQDGELGHELSQLTEKKGFVAVAFWDAGFKHFSSNVNAMTKPSDAKGQKFRIQSSKVLEEQFKVVGGSPQVMAFSEVYSALQQGVVDGTENPLSNFYTKRMYEAQKFLTLSSHGFLGYVVLINNKTWKKLSKKDKEAFVKAMKEATDLERKETIKLEKVFLDKIRAYGKTTITNLSPAQKAAWKAELIKVHPKFAPKIGQGIIDLAKKANN